MKDLDNLGKYFQEKRLKQDLSQKDVASHLGYSTPQFISNWERGISTPPLSAIPQLAKIYKVSPDEMFNKILDMTLRQTKQNLIQEYSRYKAK